MDDLISELHEARSNAPRLLGRAAARIAVLEQQLQAEQEQRAIDTELREGRYETKWADGCVGVPLEPTEIMIRRGLNACTTHGVTSKSGAKDTVTAIFNAMREAAEKS